MKKEYGNRSQVSISPLLRLPRTERIGGGVESARPTANVHAAITRRCWETIVATTDFQRSRVVLQINHIKAIVRQVSISRILRLPRTERIGGGPRGLDHTL